LDIKIGRFSTLNNAPIQKMRAKISSFGAEGTAHSSIPFMLTIDINIPLKLCLEKYNVDGSALQIRCIVI